MGFPDGSVGKKSPANRRHGRCVFDPWIGKIPWREEMATHSSILGWKIPWTEESGGLQIKGSQESGYNLSTKTDNHHF